MTYTKSVRVSEESEKKWREYQDKVNAMSLQELVKEFFTYLDYTEYSDNDVKFSPIHISCVRCLMSSPLEEVIEKMRELNAS